MPTGSIYNVYPNGRPSGLPDDIVSQLVEARKQRDLQPIQKDMSEAQQKKDNYTGLNKNLRNLYMTADKLDISSDFESFSATSTNEDAATTSATSDAEPGSYNLSIDKLAKAQHKLIGQEDNSPSDNNVTRGVRDPNAVNHALVGSDYGAAGNYVEQGVGSDDTDLADTTFEFNDGSTHSYDTSSGLTLQGLVDKINNDSETNTRAEVTELQNGDKALSLKNDSNEITGISGDIYGSGLATEQDGIRDVKFNFNHMGNTYSYDTVDEDGNKKSLNDLVDQINNGLDNTDKKAEVLAQTIELSSGEYALSLKSQNTGTGENEITAINGNIYNGGIDGLEQNTVQAAQDAQFTLDGIDYTRSSNEISDAIPGVNLSLQNSGTSSTINVSTDTEGLTQKVENMVNAFNKHDSFMKEKATYDEEEKQAGPLLGDSLARTTDNRISDIIGDKISDAGSDEYKYLSEVGIHRKEDGTLEFNKTEFQNALAQKPTEVKNLFVGEHGAAGRLKSYLQAQTQNVTGVIPKAIQSTQKDISEYEEDYSEAQTDINDYKNRMQDKYSKLEQKILEYQTQEKQLSRAIDTWDTSSD